jgi:hypothetical protein
MTFTFNRGYGEIRQLGHHALSSEKILEERSVEWLLDALKKYGTLDMISEFLKGLDRSSNSVINENYINALSDFMKFVKEYK